jgi:hypothetical protein
MRRFGGWTGEGFALGLEDTEDQIAKAYSVMTPPPPPTSPAAMLATGGVSSQLAALTAATSAGQGPTVTQHVHPTPGMSEETVAELAFRKLARAGGSL